MDGIIDSMGMSLSKLQEMAKDKALRISLNAVALSDIIGVRSEVEARYPVRNLDFTIKPFPSSTLKGKIP